MAFTIEELIGDAQTDASSGELAPVWIQFQEAVEKAGRILLSTHENPDGDGIGSELAICEHFKQMGKEVRILNGSQIPPVYEFLDPNGWIEIYDRDKDVEWLKGCDLAVVFDLGDFRRLLNVGEDLLEHKIELAGIDHHPQMGYAAVKGTPYRYNLIDFSAPSTGTLVWQYLRSFAEGKITRSMADALYTALVTDTGSFKYDNTDTRAHLMAVDLMRIGVHPYFIHKRVYEQRTYPQVNLLGQLIKHIEYSDDGRVAWCVLTQERFKSVDADLEDVEGFSEFIRAIKGVQIAAVISEVSPGKTRISMRSKGSLAINDVAQQMGGGGHPFAAGISAERPWADVLADLLPLLEAKAADFNEAEGF
ncbi:MAG: bifunctional oligoribonuclease/PAP phosphatase NrnA [Candidatus Marinimicrobia bacterium]|nr:bifunctional oligoribonuclease/PAP phosphatase NrnA [Candidatus Neomarinimicrobiota bacterium]